MCLNADVMDHSVWDSLALVFRKLLGRHHAIWTEHLAAMVMVIAKDMEEVTSRLGQFLLALQRKNIEGEFGPLFSALVLSLTLSWT